MNFKTWLTGNNWALDKSEESFDNEHGRWLSAISTTPDEGYALF